MVAPTRTDRPTAPPPDPARSPAPAPGAGRAIAALAGNELRRAFRDRTFLFFSLVLPVLIIVLIGTVFGEDQDLPVAVLDADGSAASRAIVEDLDAAEGLQVADVGSESDLRRDVRTGAVAAGVVVPAGFADDLARGEATIELVADPTSSATAAVQATVRAAVGDHAAVVAAARTAAEEGGADEEEAARTAARLAEELPGPGVTVTAVGADDEPERGNFDYTAPSNVVLFTFVNTVMAGALLALDRQRGIVRRLLATPHGTGTILAGIGAAKLSIALAQSALVLAVGALFFDVDWGTPVAYVPLIVLFAMVAAAVGLLVGSLARDPDQAAAVAVPAAIGLGMLGGCMWPLEIVPPVMRAIGHVAPHAWAMDAWRDLVFDHRGLGDIAVELAVLAGFTVVLGLLAARQLRRALTG
ncbi:MAG: ABC transporter permease [Thermoanaerobacterales bacterium]|jgi:ABC-2 type transport system permease protein|nr:ABC transporter permease [Thermoanaerobacterales bacterium]